MTNKEAVNWIINLSADIGKSEHCELWHYEQALYEIREILESTQQWILVTERLPEEKVEVLVTVEVDGKNIQKTGCCQELTTDNGKRYTISMKLMFMVGIVIQG